MPKPRSKSTRSTTSPRGNGGPSRAALLEIVRPLVKELVAEEMERLEDRLDAQDAAEALREPGEISHEEFWKKHGL